MNGNNNNNNNNNNKLNLGLMEDINENTNNLHEFNNLISKDQNCDNFTPQNNGPIQSRLDNFIDNNHVNITKPLNNKPKKLFQNLDDFVIQKELRIKIFGIGGAGNNMIKYMALNSNIKHESLFAINTDYQVLKTMPNDINVVLIGNKTTNGYGSGSDPEIGKKAALESEEIIKTLLEETDILFIVSGMGKGTGTGASPIVSKIAKEMGIMTLALVNLPSITNEGKIIFNKGQLGLTNLTKEVSGILTISNDKIFNETETNVSLEKAFNYANSVINNVISEIINLITIPAKINIDFNDVRSFFKEPIVFQVNSFEFSSHENIEEQINEQLQNLIYQDDISGAKRAIINFKLNPNINRDIVNNVTKALTSITKNSNLQITYAIDYFETVECAKVCTLLAMDKVDSELIKKVTKPAEYSIKEEKIEMEVINTKDYNSEKTLKTIELKTNEYNECLDNTNSKNNANIYNEKFIKQNETQKSFFEGFKNLKNEFSIINNEKEKINQTNEILDENASKQDVRRTFIPTKRFDQDTKEKKHKTIQFVHKTGPRDDY